MNKLNEVSNRKGKSQQGKSKRQGQITNPQTKEVTFVAKFHGAAQVYLCGDFNDWRPVKLRMIDGPGAISWEKCLTLKHGRYEYKFMVDGQWVPDPGARENVRNAYGSFNSVLEVGL